MRTAKVKEFAYGDIIAHLVGTTSTTRYTHNFVWWLLAKQRIIIFAMCISIRNGKAHKRHNTMRECAAAYTATSHTYATTNGDHNLHVAALSACTQASDMRNAMSRSASCMHDQNAALRNNVCAIQNLTKLTFRNSYKPTRTHTVQAEA